MGQPIDKITLKGFKSIRSLEDFPLQALNILIGANGAGKSNFVSFFTFLRWAVDARLRFYVNKKGGADGHLFMGPKVTGQLYAYLHFGRNGYALALEPTANNEFVFAYGRMFFEGNSGLVENDLGFGHTESKLQERIARYPEVSIPVYVYDSISSWAVYHFHDTSMLAPMRRPGSVRDNEYLRPDAANLGAYLLMLREQQRNVYEKIRDTVRLAAPFFDDFKFRPETANGDEMLLFEWTQRDSYYGFNVNHLSDGTLRFIALTTALLQPNPPATILLDEPELGLHPYALTLLAELLKKATEKTQVIVSTQSASLLDNFEAEDVVVVDRENGASTFKRLASADLEEWLKDYSLGELWEKNIFGGRPSNG